MKYVLVPSAKMRISKQKSCIHATKQGKRTFLFYRTFCFEFNSQICFDFSETPSSYSFFPTEMNFWIKKKKTEKKTKLVSWKPEPTTGLWLSWKQWVVVVKVMEPRRPGRSSGAASSKHRGGPCWYKENSICVRRPSWLSRTPWRNSNAKKMMHTVDESQDKVKMRNIEKNTGPQYSDGVSKAQARLELKLAKSVEATGRVSSPTFTVKENQGKCGPVAERGEWSRHRQDTQYLFCLGLDWEGLPVLCAHRQSPRRRGKVESAISWEILTHRIPWGWLAACESAERPAGVSVRPFSFIFEGLLKPREVLNCSPCIGLCLGYYICPLSTGRL